MSESARSPLDKEAWLRRAEYWLQMLAQRSETQLPGGPKPNDDDAKESH
jgi:hypothetical protein